MALALVASTSSLVNAQQPAWAQCGGTGIANLYERSLQCIMNTNNRTGWTGKTSCVSGHVCQAQNAYYSTIMFFRSMATITQH
jgi:hypothetical protein